MIREMTCLERQFFVLRRIRGLWPASSEEVLDCAKNLGMFIHIAGVAASLVGAPVL